MKMMKKFSLLVALAVLVTIGGVYAQWVYESTNYVAGESNNLDVSMQAYINKGNQQGYFVDKYVNMVVTLNDDLNGATPVSGNTVGDHLAEIKGHGSMLFLFKAYDQTTRDDIEQNLKFNISFEQSGMEYQYGEDDPIEIFAFINAEDKTLTPLTVDNLNDVQSRYVNLTVDESELTTDTKAGLYYIELTFDHLFNEDIDGDADGTQHHISLSEGFANTPIDTLEKWDALNSAIIQGHITVYITDTRVN